MTRKLERRTFSRHLPSFDGEKHEVQMKSAQAFDIDRLHGVLVHAKAYLHTIEDGATVVKQGTAYGDINDEAELELRADRLMGERLKQACEQLVDVDRISIEGWAQPFVYRVKQGGRIPEDDEAVHVFTRSRNGVWVTVDPIDGSLNYRLQGKTLGDPHMTVVTVLGTSKNATFGDIIAAGVIDLRRASHDTWLAWKDEDGTFHATLNGEPMKTASIEKLDPGSQVIIGETYYPENREKLNKLFEGQKGNFSRHGSASYEMAQVACGRAALFLNDRQKQHELGAGYLMVKAAGGVALDWEGDDLASHAYAFNTQTPVILAANEAIAAQVLRKMIRAWPPPLS